MNDFVLKQLSDGLYRIGKELGFSEPIIRSDRYSTEIYILKNHALQLEIDWRENNLFMYVVFLKNKALPDEGVMYSYENGQWCRKFLEEIYKTKRPNIKKYKRRYSSEYLFDSFEFYIQLISNNPVILTEFFKSIDNSE